MIREDGDFVTQRINDTPVVRGTFNFMVPESLVAGQSLHRSRPAPTAEDIIEAWLEGDEGPWPDNRYDQWLTAAEEFLEKTTYDKLHHLSLLVRAFEVYIQERGLV